jgi:hypothetical protein
MVLPIAIGRVPSPPAGLFSRHRRDHFRRDPASPMSHKHPRDGANTNKGPRNSVCEANLRKSPEERRLLALRRCVGAIHLRGWRSCTQGGRGQAAQSSSIDRLKPVDWYVVVGRDGVSPCLRPSSDGRCGADLNPPEHHNKHARHRDRDRKIEESVTHEIPLSPRGRCPVEPW